MSGDKNLDSLIKRSREAVNRMDASYERLLRARVAQGVPGAQQALDRLLSEQRFNSHISQMEEGHKLIGERMRQYFKDDYDE